MKRELQEVFGRAWASLGFHQRRAVEEDAKSLAAEEKMDLDEAAKELWKRIGGRKNLESYANTLLAGNPDFK